MPNFTDVCSGLAAIGDSWGLTLILAVVVYAIYKTQMRNMDIELMIHDDIMFSDKKEIEFILDDEELEEDDHEPRAKK